MLRGAPSPSLWLGIVPIKHGPGHPSFSLDGCSCGLSIHLGFVMVSLSAVVCLRATGQCLVQGCQAVSSL